MPSADWPVYDDFVVMCQATNKIPEVSVIVPSYNKEANRLLEECLRSLINQTECSLEIIVVDDCSTDNSLSIAIEIASEVNNVTVLAMKQNHRQGAARNRGLSIARGAYVGFVDADDTVEPWYFERMLAEIKLQESDVVVAPYRRVDLKGKALSASTMDTPQSCAGKISSSSFAQLILHHDFFWSQLWRIDTKKSVPRLFPEDILYEDTPTMLRWLAGASSISLLKGEAGYNYRANPNSTNHTTGLNRNALNNRLCSGEMILTDAKDLGFYKLYQEEYDWYFLQVYLMNTCKSMIQAGNQEAEFFRDLTLQAAKLVPTWHSNRYFLSWPTTKRIFFSLLMRYPLAAYQALSLTWSVKCKLKGINHG